MNISTKNIKCCQISHEEMESVTFKIKKSSIGKVLLLVTVEVIGLEIRKSHF